MSSSVLTACASTAVQPPSNQEDLAQTLSALSEQFAIGAPELDLHGHFPHENFRRLHDAGLIAYAAPQPHGQQAGVSQCRKVIGAVAYAEPATALVLTMTYLQHRQLSRPASRWPQALQARVLASAARDGALMNTLRVEPDLGTPARGGLPATIARREGDGWRLTGRKIYATGIPALRWLTVWARTDEEHPRTGIFLVERTGADQPGLRVVENWNHLGLRASGSHEVIFDSVPIALDHAVDLRPADQWKPERASALEQADYADQHAWMTILLGTLYDAVARAAYDWVLKFLAERVPSNLGAPLSSLPRIQESVGAIAALLHTNAILLAHAAAQTDAGNVPTVADSGLLKLTVTANAIDAVERALRLSGNAGLSRNNPLERHYRDVLCSRVHTPQDDSIVLAAGQQAFARRLADLTS